MTEMITPNRWVHSFDLWGVLVDQRLALAETMRLYRDIAEINGLASEVIADALAKYQAVLDGTFPADKKKEYIAPVGTLVGSSLLDSSLKERTNPDFSRAFYDDGIDAVRRILDSGEAACIFSTSEAREVNETLASKFPDIARRMSVPNYALKSKPAGFHELAQKVGGLGMKLATHTEDEIIPVNAALDSGAYSGKIVLVDKTGKAIAHPNYRSDPRIMVVNNLNGVDYRQLTNRGR